MCYLPYSFRIFRRVNTAVAPFLLLKKRFWSPMYVRFCEMFRGKFLHTLSPFLFGLLWLPPCGMKYCCSDIVLRFCRTKLRRHQFSSSLIIEATFLISLDNSPSAPIFA